jgi:hypothetical protein
VNTSAPGAAIKASWTADLIRSVPPPEQIVGLRLIDKKLSVTLLPKNGKLRPSVEVRGSFDHPGWALFIGKTRLIAPQTSGNQNFSVVAYLNGRTSDVTWTAKGPKGEEVIEKIVLLAPEAQEFRIGPQWGEASVFLGLASFHFFQTQFGSYDSSAGLFAVRYDTTKGVSPYGLTADIDLTYFTLVSKPAKYTPTTLAASVDATYRPSWNFKDGSIQPTFQVGLHYASMLANGFPYGFSNLIAPEFGLRVMVDVTPERSWLYQVRYVPIAGIFSLSEADLDLTVGWITTLENHHRVEVDLGYWKLGYKPEPSTVITNRLLYIRVGYSI